MTVDNFESIARLLRFESDDEFYFIQIIKRRKENPEMDSNHLIFKTYYIDSIELFHKVTEEIKKVCRALNARAYINLNRRSFKKTALRCNRGISGFLFEENYRNIRNVYNSEMKAHKDEYSPRWVIDVDADSEKIPTGDFIQKLQRDTAHSPFIEWIPTPNGMHIISSPFNLSEFKSHYPAMDVHTDGLTVLYF
jgi:hypothetical protein